MEHAVPRDVLRARDEVKKEVKEGQKKLDGIFRKARPKEFARDSVLSAVAEFVVCDNQVCINPNDYLVVAYYYP